MLQVSAETKLLRHTTENPTMSENEFVALRKHVNKELQQNIERKLTAFKNALEKEKQQLLSTLESERVRRQRRPQSHNIDNVDDVWEEPIDW